jgi:hypothetical protein
MDDRCAWIASKSAAIFSVPVRALDVQTLMPFLERPHIRVLFVYPSHDFHLDSKFVESAAAAIRNKAIQQHNGTDTPRPGSAMSATSVTAPVTRSESVISLSGFDSKRMSADESNVRLPTTNLAASTSLFEPIVVRNKHCIHSFV